MVLYEYLKMDSQVCTSYKSKHLQTFSVFLGIFAISERLAAGSVQHSGGNERRARAPADLQHRQRNLPRVSGDVVQLRKKIRQESLDVSQPPEQGRFRADRKTQTARHDLRHDRRTDAVRL